MYHSFKEKSPPQHNIFVSTKKNLLSSGCCIWLLIQVCKEIIIYIIIQIRKPFLSNLFYSLVAGLVCLPVVCSFHYLCLAWSFLLTAVWISEKEFTLWIRMSSCVLWLSYGIVLLDIVASLTNDWIFALDNKIYRLRGNIRTGRIVAVDLNRINRWHNGVDGFCR